MNLQSSKDLAFFREKSCILAQLKLATTRFVRQTGKIQPYCVKNIKEKFSEIREDLSARGNAFVQLLVDVVYDRKQHGRFAEVLTKVLFLLSYLFHGLVRLRWYLYENRILRNTHLGCLVVVVGNLTVGGTGKTPVVEKFARSLHNRGRKVAILSRGYKSKNEGLPRTFWRKLTHGEESPPKIVSDGENVLLDSEVAGDEPYMLARNLPGVVVLCDKNRVKAGSYAIRKFGCDTLILDDGFQYLPLKGRLNLLLVDKTNPFGNQHLLPRGILREPIQHLSRASYILLTKSDGGRDESLLELIREHNSKAEIIECAHKPQFLQAFGSEAQLPLEALRGCSIAAFSGIATPESFEAMLRKQGAEIRYNKRFLDHHRFSDNEIQNIFTEVAQLNDVTMIVTTEKDAVRLAEGVQAPVPIYYLRLEIDILSGQEDFEAAVSRICFPRHDSAKKNA